MEEKYISTLFEDLNVIDVIDLLGKLGIDTNSISVFDCGYQKYVNGNGIAPTLVVWGITIYEDRTVIDGVYRGEDE